MTFHNYNKKRSLFFFNRRIFTLDLRDPPLGVPGGGKPNELAVLSRRGRQHPQHRPSVF